jgi:hypothetical protein
VPKWCKIFKNTQKHSKKHATKKHKKHHPQIPKFQKIPQFSYNKKLKIKLKIKK